MTALLNRAPGPASCYAIAALCGGAAATQAQAQAQAQAQLAAQTLCARALARLARRHAALPSIQHNASPPCLKCAAVVGVHCQCLLLPLPALQQAAAAAVAELRLLDGFITCMSV